MTNLITVKWDLMAKDEAEINFSPEFESLHKATKLDALNDALSAINKKHKEILATEQY